ncbi:MAG: bifunctional metallophosphatase/5'-nucleotidase [Opitutaceae bacterium]
MSLFGLILAGLLAGVSPAIGAEHAQITVLSTTDLHGHLLPVDYHADKPDSLGLAKLGTLIRRVRRSAPDALLIDCGDTIQGTPLAYYHARRNNTPPDPMMLAMNALGFDALAIGNHEYNYGLDVLEKARSEAAFPWLSGNTYRVSTGEPAFEPWIVREVAGVRVGIAGLTTPGIPAWENPENFAGLEFRDPVEAARRWVEHLRGTENVDVVIVAMHMGLEVDLRTGEMERGLVERENAAVAIAREVRGIDLILMGHTHREVPSLVIGDVLLAQANRWGDRLIRADIYLEREEANADWMVVARSSRSIPVTAATKSDPEIVALAEPYEKETQEWLSKQIGHSAAGLRATDARLRDTAILDLVQRVQLDAGEAGVSFAASFSTSARVPEGAVTVRDIASLYIYDNTLTVIELTGTQIKQALEHSARYFLPYEEGKTPRELIDNRIPGYNFDVAQGVDYAIDLRRPPGSRIVDLKFQGEPIEPSRKFRVAINNHRFNGGGGYTMFQGAPVLWRSSADIRDLIIAWVERHGEIPSEPDGNWRIVQASEGG